MIEPVFLHLDEVIEIHDDQIKRYGGHPGIREIDLLKSAVAMPKASIGGDFLHADIYEMAAAYLFHIARNHPFMDGNKRTGAVAAIVFMEMNGIVLNVNENTLVVLVLSVAEGKTDRIGTAQVFRNNSSKTEPSGR